MENFKFVFSKIILFLFIIASFGVEIQGADRTVINSEGVPVIVDDATWEIIEYRQIVATALTRGDYEFVTRFIRDITDADDSFDINNLCINKPEMGLVCITPLLFFAVDLDVPEAVQCLLDAGADVNVKDRGPFRRTPLYHAAEYGNTNAARVLLENGALLNEQNSEGCNALTPAVMENNIPLVCMLLDAGILVNMPNFQGTTPLLGAVTQGNADIVKLLLDAGAYVGVVDVDGYTPLSIATKGGRKNNGSIVEPNEAITRLLLAAGAEPTQELFDQLNTIYTKPVKRGRGKAVVMREMPPFIEAVMELHLAILRTRGEAFSEADLLKEEESRDAVRKTRRKKGKGRKDPSPVPAVSPEGMKEASKVVVSDEVFVDEGPVPAVAAVCVVSSGDMAIPEWLALSLSERLCLNDYNQITINFHPDRRGRCGYGGGRVIPVGKNHLVPLRVFELDQQEESLGALLHCKNSSTAGGLILLQPRLFKCLCAQLRTMRTELSEDVVDHAFSMGLMIKALVNGQAYISRDTTNPLSKPCLLIVAAIDREVSPEIAPFASGDKHWLTLCFDISTENKIKHCYHCCVQQNHPRDVRESGRAKYDMHPVDVSMNFKVKNQLRDRYQLRLKILDTRAGRK